MRADTDLTWARAGVLIVDDTEGGEILAAELIDRGYPTRHVAGSHVDDLIDLEDWPEILVVDPDACGLTRLGEVLAHPGRCAVTAFVWSASDPAKGLSMALELGADGHLEKDAPPADLATRIEVSLRSARRLLETSPLTGLPGNVRIQQELVVRTGGSEPLAVVHADIDHFKEFNDRYGFARGDEAIRFCATCLRDAASSVAGGSVFIGHIGGDDFVVMLGAAAVDRFCTLAIERWDARVPELYDEDDRTRGWMELVDRRGNVRTFPPAGLSLGVATNVRRPFTSPWHAAAVAAEMKEYAKRRPGSNYRIDRRG